MLFFQNIANAVIDTTEYVRVGLTDNKFQNVLKQEDVAKKQTAAKATVEEPSKLGDGIGSIKDQNKHNDNGQEKQKQKDNEPKQEKETYYISDPSLGQHIDVSG